MKSILKTTLLVLVGCGLASSPIQAKKKPLKLQPSSKWEVNYANDSCRLIRQFGWGKERVTAIFNRYKPGDQFQLTLAGEQMIGLGHRPKVAVQFGPSEKLQNRTYSVGRLGPKMPALILADHMRIGPTTETEKKERERAKPELGYRFTPVSLERYAAVTSLTVGRAIKQPVVLELGSLDGPFTALSACIDELLTHWGIDVEKHKNLSQQVVPVGNLRNWITYKDYPKELLQKSQSVTIQIRLIVDLNGAPASCHIQQTTRPKEIDDAVCKTIMERAEFNPALDAEGRPTTSYWQTTVKFFVK